MPNGIEVGRLNVLMGDRRVGIIALDDDGLACFEYDSDWLAGGFSISPLSLPLEKRLFRPSRQPFDGMFGVFADSLPDGWGRLLVDRALVSQGIFPEDVDELSRLAIVGSGGMGALRYEPETVLHGESASGDLDQIAEACKAVLADKPVENLDELFALGGSSGGARPKALVQIEGESWIVKFPTRADGNDAGRLEYEYSLCARECGLRMPETRLFPSKLTGGYFGAKRFDREGDSRIHMVSAGGLLEATHRLPSLDYRMLMQLTLLLTHDMDELGQLFRLMCFNVFAHNQDDHAKNFSFICKDGRWQLSPAYDLTFSRSFGNEHATMARGKGNPEMEDLLAIADEFGLPKRQARMTAREIQDACSELVTRNRLA